MAGSLGPQRRRRVEPRCPPRRDVGGGCRNRDEGGGRQPVRRRVERRHGTFSRSFTLPNTVDASRISAAYKDGVLTVRLPQREEAKPKQIDVNVG